MKCKIGCINNEVDSCDSQQVMDVNFNLGLN